MNNRQQQSDVLARNRERLARILKNDRETWRDRVDRIGDEIARREEIDRQRERGDDPSTWLDAA